MLEQEFLRKWRNDLDGYWATRPSTVFWARAYDMNEDELKEMSEDYLSIPTHRVPCCESLARTTLGWNLTHG